MRSLQKRLGDILLERGVITPDELDFALERQREDHRLLGQVIISSGFGTEEDVYQALSELFHVDFIRLDGVFVDPKISQLIPKLLAITRDVLPLHVEDNYLYLAMENPRDFDVIQIIEFSTHRQVKPLLSTFSQLQSSIRSVYHLANQASCEVYQPRNFSALDVSPRLLGSYTRLLRQPQGLLIVTGSPLNSSKVDFLYTSLQTLHHDLYRNVITIEDPVSAVLEGVKQIQVHEEAGLSMHNILSLLSGPESASRRDPDVIMVGELRDATTAKISLRLAETGHFMLSTTATEDCLSALTDLLNLGLAPGVLAANLLGIVAVKSVRRLCPQCKQAYLPTREGVAELGFAATRERAETWYRPVGCPACDHTGYSGDILLYEMFLPDERIRETIAKRPSPQQLNQLRDDAGMKSLFEKGVEKIRLGETTWEEVTRKSCCHNERRLQP